MTILATFKSDFGTGLSITSYKVSVINKFPWCVLQFEVVVNQESTQVKLANNQFAPTYFKGYPATFEAWLGNVPILWGRSRSSHRYFLIQNKAIFVTTVSIEAIDHIEKNRADDVQLSCEIIFALEELANTPTGPHQSIEHITADLDFVIELSAKKWISLLSQMGYNDKWIVELDRPKLEGYKEIMEYVLKAQDALYNKREAEDVLRDLRAARDSFKTFFDANETKIAEIIDSGSKGESDQKPKSKRIKEIYDKIAYFLNIGPHNDKYEVTYADAQLAFRQFVSVLSYLSEVLTQVKDD